MFINYYEEFINTKISLLLYQGQGIQEPVPGPGPVIKIFHQSFSVFFFLLSKKCALLVERVVKKKTGKVTKINYY